MGKYDDIIHHPHHVSATHPQMPMRDRAAQFSPFAALTGYDAAVRETARSVDQKSELDEEQKAEIDRVLRQAAGKEIAAVHFVPDERKCGGAYVTTRGIAERVDLIEGVLVTDQGRIRFDDLYSIEIQESPSLTGSPEPKE